MEIKNIVLVAVVVILLGSLTVPLIDDYTSEHTYTYTNQGSNVVRTNLYEDMTDMTVDITYINSTPYISINSGDPYAAPVYGCDIASDGFNMRFYSSSVGLFYVDGVINNAYPYDGSLHISISDSIAHIRYANYQGIEQTEITTPITWVSIYDASGSMVNGLVEASSKVCFYSDFSNVRGANWIGTTSEWYSYVGQSVSVGADQTSIQLSNVQHLAGDAYSVVFSSSDNAGVTFTVDNDGTPYVVKPYVYVTDYQITVAAASDSAIISLLWAIPVIIIVAALVMIVAGFSRKK